MAILKVGAERIIKAHLMEEADTKTIASISLSSGKIQTPKWKSLQRYWTYAKYSEIEYANFSICLDKILFYFTVASGQGGILALWDCSHAKWLNISEGSYVFWALLNWKHETIISFHKIYGWGIPLHHKVFATPVNGSKDAWCNSSCEIPLELCLELLEFDFRNIEIDNLVAIDQNIINSKLDNYLENMPKHKTA